MDISKLNKNIYQHFQQILIFFRRYLRSSKGEFDFRRIALSKNMLSCFAEMFEQLPQKIHLDQVEKPTLGL